MIQSGRIGAIHSSWTLPPTSSSFKFHPKYTATKRTLSLTHPSSYLRRRHHRPRGNNLSILCSAAFPTPSSPADNDKALTNKTASSPASNPNQTTANASSSAIAKATERASRLETAFTLRKLYRNLLRAGPLLDISSPIYQPPSEEENKPSVLDPDVATTTDLAAATAADIEAQQRIDEAVYIVAEMELTAEELRYGMRALKAAPERYGLLFKGEDPSAIEKRISSQVRDVYASLIQRVAKEIQLLPFPTVAAAQNAIDTRNARYRKPGINMSSSTASAAAASVSGSSVNIGSGGASDSEGAPEGGYLHPDQRRGLSERLSEAEKVAERFVALRLQPAVAKVRDTSPEGLIEGVQRSAMWAQGLWDRLNGAPVDIASGIGPQGLPLLSSTEAERAAAAEALHREIEELEKKLQEASKARETRLRKAGIQSRARIAAELRQMDNEVAAVSRALAVRTLQLEIEYIYGCLEVEARDILGDPSVVSSSSEKERVALALARRGSTDEVALLAAEFKQLDAELAGLVADVESGGALYLDDGELAALASEIPDLRSRLGVGDDAVFGGSGLSLNKIQLQAKTSIMKVMEAFNFGIRGVRLLGSDVASAVKLFLRAIAGGTLKPREVAALRRTARDLLTFIPFTIILILPLTPVGHVLIFGFIQRYFPGFFPSQFTTRRQDLMMKYEELKRQLQMAQIAADLENDELEFQKAAAALWEKKNSSSASGSGSSSGSDLDGIGSVMKDDASTNAAVLENINGGSNGGSNNNNNNNGSASLQVSFSDDGDNTKNSRGTGNNTNNTNDNIDESSISATNTMEGEESEGPAAAAVRKLEQELAAAADSSYTDIDD